MTTSSPQKTGSTESTPSQTAPSGSFRSGRLFDKTDVPQMAAEVGFEVVSDDGVAELRPSGLVALVLGVLSFSAMIAWPMLAVPVAAIAFGVFALRKHEGPRPVGTTPAILGLALACGFGAAGAGLIYFKYQTMGKQAAYFAEEYLKLIAQGDVNLAIELQKEPRNRQLASMDLTKVYERDEVARIEREEADYGPLDDIENAGPNVQWELAQMPRPFIRWGDEKVETQWIDASGKISNKLIILLEWYADPDTGEGQWRVERCAYHRERIVAPTVL